MTLHAPAVIDQPSPAGSDPFLWDAIPVDPPATAEADPPGRRPPAEDTGRVVLWVEQSDVG